MKKERIPKVGEVLPFFDDGKVSYMRLSMATVKEVLPFKKAPDYVKAAFKKESKEHGWIFGNTTDYFIGCDIPDYDKNEIWFARMKNGGWFSMDIQSSWQGGYLDVYSVLKRMLDREYERLQKCRNAI